jgi:hypothetical protein
VQPGIGAARHTLEKKQALELANELPHQRFRQVIRPGGFSGCAEQAVFAGAGLRGHGKRYKPSEDFNLNFVFGLLVTSLDAPFDVFSAQSESISVNGFPGENFLSHPALNIRALALKAPLTSVQNLEADAFLVLCSSWCWASSSAFRALPALNSWAILLAQGDSVIEILPSETCVNGSNQALNNHRFTDYLFERYRLIC